MHIDPDELHSGANRLYEAAWLAQEGADKLSQATTGTGIFGAFAAAESFHSEMKTSHDKHIDRLVEHQQRLGVLGDKTHKTASVFVEMEERNACALREASCLNIQT